jgi:hypothetical protein
LVLKLNEPKRQPLFDEARATGDLAKRGALMKLPCAPPFAHETKNLNAAGPLPPPPAVLQRAHVRHPDKHHL